MTVLLVSLAGLVAAPPASAEGGSRLVYEQNGELVATGPQGTQPHVLARFAADIADIDATPDGRSIVLLANRGPAEGTGSERTILLYRVAQGKSRVLGPFRSIASRSIAISPDGKKIAYGRDTQIWVTGINGKGAHAVTDGGGGTPTDFSFAPNSSTIYFARGEDGHSQIFRTTLGGGPETALTSGGGRAILPRVANGGSSMQIVAYVEIDPRTGAETLTRMNPDGSAVQAITTVQGRNFIVDFGFSPNFARTLAVGVGHTYGSATVNSRVLTIRSSGQNPRVAIRSGKGRITGPVWTKVP